MDFDWKNWCKFCGNADNNVKFESTIDIEYYFKISDPHPKICQPCSVSVNEFQEFVEKTDRTNRLFQELLKEKHLDNFKINEIREKYNLVILEVKQEINFLELNLKEDSDRDYDLNLEDYQNDPEDIKEETVKKRSKRKCKKNNKGTLKSDDEEHQSNDPTWDPEPIEKSKKSKNSRTVERSEYKLAKAPIIKVIEMICHICKEEHSSMMFLVKHCLKEHDCRPQVPCICGYILNNYETYNKHRKRCCGKFESPFHCDLCGANFSVKFNLEKHMSLMHRTDSRKLICKTCHKSFKEPALLRYHERIHLPDHLRLTHPCPQCPKKFASKAQVTQHIKLRHKQLEKSWTCHLCAKSFSLKACLDAHFISHSTTYNFNCDVCSKKFKSKYLLKCHQQVHEAPQHYCEICGKVFRRLSSKTKHIQVTHSDERPFSCLELSCTKKFKTKENAKVHYNEIHLGRLRYQCKYCSDTKGFYQTKDRLEHMRLQHPKEYLEHIEKYKFFGSKNRLVCEEKI